MTVFDQGFRVYQGPLTSPWQRFLVVARYGLMEAISSRRTLALLILGWIPPLVASCVIYIRHNVDGMAILGVSLAEVVPIDGQFFWVLSQVQVVVALWVFSGAGATLISSDLRDNALPLYLGRPLRRSEYALGKITVLFALGSIVTWIPLLVLYGLQTGLEGIGWGLEHFRWVFGVFVGSWVGMLLLGLVILAASAALRNRAAAETAYVGFFVTAPVLGSIVNQTLRTEVGVFANFFLTVPSHFRGLMGLSPSEEVGAVGSTLALVVFCTVAAWVLRRRIRAYEVES